MPTLMLQPRLVLAVLVFIYLYLICALVANKVSWFLWVR